MKITKYEKNRRIDLIAKLLISGINFKDIFAYINDKDGENWNVKESQVRKYLKFARDEIKSQNHQDRTEHIALAIARLNDLYQKSYTIQDYKTSLQIQKELNSLLGLYFEDSILTKIDNIEEKINKFQLFSEFQNKNY